MKYAALLFLVVLSFPKYATSTQETWGSNGTTTSLPRNTNTSDATVTTQSTGTHRSTNNTIAHGWQNTLSPSFEALKVERSREICDGFSCMEGEFCSTTEGRCRQCNIFDDACNNITWVNQKAAACEVYCRKKLIRDLETRCLEDKNTQRSVIEALEKNNSKTEEQWVQSITEKDDHLTQCKAANENLTSLLEAQNYTLENLRTEVNELRRKSEACEERLEKTQTVLSVCLGLFCGLGVLVGTIVLCWCHKRRDRVPLDYSATLANNRANNRICPIFLGRGQESATKDPKQPTEVDRRNNRFNPCEDEMVPSGQTHGHSPAQSSETEPLKV